MNNFLQGDYTTAPADPVVLILALMLAFLIGQVIAWIYMLTHSGLSYSRSFVNSLIVLPVLVALVMMVLANNLITAFGLLAVFAIVRFRNILRDTLDTAYVLSVIVIGMACGTQRFSTALVGLAAVSAILLYLWFTSFGVRNRYDIILNLHWARPLSELPALGRLIDRHSRRAICASQRAGNGQDGADLSYRLLLRDTDRIEELLHELRSLQGVSRVTSLKAEETSEM